MVIKQIRPFIPLILTLLLALVLFFLVEDFLRSVLIGPLLYVAWLVSLVAESLPHTVIWAGFLLVMLIIAFASLRNEKQEEYYVRQLPSRNTGSVKKWANLLDNAQKDRFTKWRLANELKRLTRRLISNPESEESVHDQYLLELPEEITAYFEAQQPTRIPFREWLSNYHSDEPDSPLDLDPEVVIQYLEKRLGR
jgi:hypothetical protein